MKASAPSLISPGTTDKIWVRDVAAPAFSPASALCRKSLAAVLADLFKARLTLLVLLTTLVGFYAGFQGPVDYLLMLHTVLGTALVASGAAALNQLWERKYDALMRRTRERPLPSGRLQPATVLRIGAGCSIVGLIYLLLAVNVVTAALGAASLLIYVFLYTPLKRVTWLNTAVGAIPGGLPPLMGWTAARGHMGFDGLSLFVILALWQIPHFMAIAWLYRDEYARAGFRMLPVIDPEGLRTSRQAVIHTLLLLPASLCPVFFHFAGTLYLAGAALLGLLFLLSAVAFARRLTISAARQLFYVSIAYLPLLLILMVLDKTR